MNMKELDFQQQFELKKILAAKEAEERIATNINQIKENAESNTEAIKKLDKLPNLDAVISLQLQIDKLNQTTDNNKDVQKKIDIEKTTADGDCALHAALGILNVNKVVHCNDANQKRKEMSDAILKCTKDSPILPSIIEAIQAILMGEQSGFVALRQEYNAHLAQKENLIAQAWRDFHAELVKRPELCQYIEAKIIQYKTSHQQHAMTHKQKFLYCLDLEGGLLRCLIISNDALKPLFEAYNKNTHEGFNLKAKILQNRQILEEYANYIAQPRRWLLPAELNIIAHVFNITIHFYTYNPYKRTTIGPEIYNPNQNKSVLIRFDGFGHFERMRNTAATPVSVINVSKEKAEARPQILSLADLRLKLNRIRRVIEQAPAIYKFIGRSTEQGKPFDTHILLQTKIKEFIEKLKEKIMLVEEMLVEAEQDLTNDSYLKNANIKLNRCEQENKEKGKELKEMVAKCQPTLPEDEAAFLEDLLERINASFQNNRELSKNDLRGILENKLFECTLPKLKEKNTVPPSCFISYSWTTPAHVHSVHEIALHLKLAGINVILDVWQNTTGSIEAFTENAVKSDYIIVVGTKDLMEKWENFTSLGKSRNKVGIAYTGNVVCSELEKILMRKRNMSDDSHGIINLLLDGEHRTAFPLSLQALPSDGTDFRNKNNYTRAFFNLLEKLQPKITSDAKINTEAYKILLREEKKKLIEQISSLMKLNEEQLLKLYKENVLDTQKTTEMIMLDTSNALKALRENTKTQAEQAKTVQTALTHTAKVPAGPSYLEPVQISRLTAAAGSVAVQNMLDLKINADKPGVSVPIVPVAEPKLAFEKYSHEWEAIKAQCLKTGNKVGGVDVGTAALKAMVEYRDIIDFRFYRQAVEAIFPIKHYNLTADVNGDIQYTESQPRFVSAWYEFKVTPRATFEASRGQTLPAACKIKINAPGSRTLTSDIDTSIVTRLEGDLETLLKQAKVKGADYAGYISNAMIDGFYTLSEKEFKMTSGEHRDSNAYRELSDEEDYPKFRLPDSQVLIGDKPLFIEAELRKQLLTFKAQKHELELAASLFSLRDALKDAWPTFVKQVQETVTHVSQSLEDGTPEGSAKATHYLKATTEDLEAIFKRTEDFYKEYCPQLTAKKQTNPKGIYLC
jgi:hypothetical protein